MNIDVNDYLNFVDYIETERTFQLEELYLDEWENEPVEYGTAAIEITDEMIDW